MTTSLWSHFPGWPVLGPCLCRSEYQEEDPPASHDLGPGHLGQVALLPKEGGITLGSPWGQAGLVETSKPPQGSEEEKVQECCHLMALTAGWWRKVPG